MSVILFILFVVLPIAEVATFVAVGHYIGVPAVIALSIATAFAGSFLMRKQGFAALNRFMGPLEKGEMPVNPVIDGMGVLAAGVLLIVPGFLTDVIGFLLFIPSIRRLVGRNVVRRLLASKHMKFRYYGNTSQPHSPEPPRPGMRPKDTGPKKSDNVVDAEFETVDPRKDFKTGTRAKRVDEKDASGKKDTNEKSSPWRKN